VQIRGNGCDNAVGDNTIGHGFISLAGDTGKSNAQDRRMKTARSA
jgi:hypothetical protein